MDCWSLLPGRCLQQLDSKELVAGRGAACKGVAEFYDPNEHFTCEA